LQNILAEKMITKTSINIFYDISFQKLIRLFKKIKRNRIQKEMRALTFFFKKIFNRST